MKIELRARDVKIMAGDLTDPPETLLQGAAVHREPWRRRCRHNPGTSRGELGAVNGVVVEQCAEPGCGEPLNGEMPLRDLLYA
jgi:hypothetical protein